MAAYQVATAAGGVDGRASAPGGARLVFVGKVDKDGVATERVQPGFAPEELHAWRETIHEAAAVTRGPGFTAQVNETCRHCPVRTSCPAQDSGRQVTE